MQSENFDKKIRDSLSQRPPGNDNPAWDKMEPLLDQHMPREKKDRRRIIFLLFAFLLLGGGAFLIWQNGRENNNNISANGSQKEDPSSKKTSNSPGNAGTAASTNNIRAEKTSEQKPVDGNEQVKVNPQQTRNKTEATNGSASISTPGPVFTVSNPSKTKKKKQVNDLVSSNTDPVSQQKQLITDEKKPDIAPSTKTTDDNTKSLAIVNDAIPDKQAAPQQTNAEEKQTEQKTETRESQPTIAAQSKAQNQKPKKSFLSNVFLTVSTGADLSTVGIDNAGTIKPIVGAGIGYQVSNKFSLRTGFYSARKVYSAAPDEYHPPYNLQAYYPNLKTIEANCKVYEIPLTIDYTISNNKKHSWFASAGMSSLIMKEEVYDYYYKPVSSPTYITYRRTIKDQNKHYFSVLSLSGGYRKNISSNFSLQAEPYMKIATNGVGFGKVKLNSGGVLISAVIRPFGKK